MTAQPITAADSGTFTIGGDLTVNRLGYGTMQLTGKGVWGDPQDPDEAVRVLKRSIELGVNFIDTADSYGPVVAEPLIRQALHPYTDDLVVATKAGLTRSGPNDWRPVGRPEYLRQQAEMSLRHLGLERIDLFQLHRIDPKVPLAEQLGELELLRKEGKIRHIGLSEVSVEQLREAREITEIVSVQNLYNLSNRKAEDVLEECEASGIAFIPWFPLATGELARDGGPLDDISKRLNAKPAQIALAWLLRRSPVILPIPGTSSVAHLEDNIEAAGLELSDEDIETLNKLA
ncbi:aldo/keto reductase [Saccharibacillus sp. CPCC 101409]|uniref:aldo/keto reductase n=1 Tax=Saccharibacillus sp. CPCC 101409 TaxID=3058041 RepID=UPI002672C0B7|nr:aldo/keto reductase [Saccharibacillus sp. CPCC 101409]MDO3412215.1 aldo/keto reductase [Saccharibacillus sp. CPCC 101409]